MNIKDYIPYYIGCRVLIDDKEYGTLMGGSFVPNSVDQIYYNIITDEAAAEGDDFQMPYNDDTSPDCRIKPLLRRLSDMTDKEWDEIEVKTSLMQEAYGFNAVRDNFMIGTDEYRLGWTIVNEALNLLRKAGVDVDGLIDAGVAIDSNTINK